jgi:DNA-binding NarL/FixJ family response regulator
VTAIALPVSPSSRERSVEGAFPERPRVVTDEFKQAALAAGNSAERRIALGSLFVELTSSEAQVEACFLTRRAYYVVLSGTQTGPGPSLQREMQVLKRILLGEQQKVIALELRLSDSSIATAAARAARALGFQCPARQIPVVVMMAAWDAEEPGVTVPCATLEWAGSPYRVVRVERPSSTLLEGLSDSEHSIVELLMERRSNEEIARERNRSERTVANQLGSIIKKLNVSSRSGVLTTLAARWCRATRAQSAVQAAGVASAGSSTN